MSDGDPTAPGRADAPLAAADRIVTLDVLRGAALLGIFIMNMPGFSHSLFAPPAAESSALAGLVVGLREALFAGKFNLLFGLLFGIGFALQLARLDAAQPARAAWIYGRRLAALLAIGLVHAVWLWPGDVLVVYAVLGFALLAVRRLPDRALLALLALCLLYPAFAEALRPTIFSPQTETLAAFEYEAFQASNDLAYGHGSFIDAARETAHVFAWTYSSPLGLFSIAAFYVQMATGILAGYLIGRRGWPTRLPALAGEVRRVQRRAITVVLICALVGIALAGAMDTGAATTVFVAMLARTLGRAALAVVYATAVVRLVATRGDAAWWRPLALAGRMPLTNYLMQTVLASIVCDGWGLGLWGRIGPTGETAIALALFFCVQLPLTRAWLARFRYGPVEYLWRLLTYGRRSL